MPRSLVDFMGLRAAETLLPLVVDVNGDTMKGPLEVLNPTADNHPATKKMVADEVERAVQADSDLTTTVAALAAKVDVNFPVPFAFPDPATPGEYEILIDNPSPFTITRMTTKTRQKTAECTIKVDGVPVPGLSKIAAGAVKIQKTPANVSGVLVPAGSYLTAVLGKVELGVDRVRADLAAKSGVDGGLPPALRNDFAYNVDAVSTPSVEVGNALTSGGFVFARASEWWNEDLVQTAASGVLGIDPIRGLFIEAAATNLFLNAFAPVTQSISLPVGTYIVHMIGEGSLTLSNAFVGIVTKANVATFTLASTTTLNVACTGDVKYVFVGVAGGKTSPVKSLAAPATRAVATLVATRIVGQLAAGTLFVKGRAPYAQVAAQTIWQADDNSDSNRIQLRLTVGGAIQLQSIIGGVVTPLFTIAPSIAPGSDYVCAVNWQNGAWNMRGKSLSSVTSSAASPTGLVRERWGAMASGAQPYNGGLIWMARSASIWSTAEMDAWLAVS